MNFWTSQSDTVNFGLANHRHHGFLNQPITDPLNNTSSPYRGKNYKLLLEMITKAAIRAYRSELRISGDRYTLNWVEKFIHRNDMEGGPNLKVCVCVCD